MTVGTHSTGIMRPSQVCKRFVVPPKLDQSTGRHRREAGNYFLRAPENPVLHANQTRAIKRRVEAEVAAAQETVVAVLAPPVALLEEPEPAPPPRVEVDPEVIVSWGSWSRAELYEQARELDIKGRSSMTKRMLLKALVAYVRND